LHSPASDVVLKPLGVVGARPHEGELEIQQLPVRKLLDPCSKSAVASILRSYTHGCQRRWSGAKRSWGRKTATHSRAERFVILEVDRLDIHARLRRYRHVDRIAVIDQREIE